MISRFIDSYQGYEVLRKIFLLGLRTKPVLNALDLRPGERILDAACGYACFSKYFSDGDYTGIDLDPQRIAWAKMNLGEAKDRRFLLADATRTPFAPKSFEKALGHGLLHHLSDRDAEACVRELSRVVSGRIVFLESVYSHVHLINNLLCLADRGRFVRWRDEYLKLCETSLRVIDETFYYARNGLAKYILITAVPKDS